MPFDYTLILSHPIQLCAVSSRRQSNPAPKELGRK